MSAPALKQAAALVPALRQWIAANTDRLGSKGVAVIDKLPRSAEASQDKGCVGLAREPILISLTAWEDRTPLIMELIVFNARLGRTVIVEEVEIDAPATVLEKLDDVATALAAGSYDDIQPSPELWRN